MPKPSQADNEFDCYDALTSAEAKREYFLTTDDLHSVPYHVDSFMSGFGCGRPTKWYKYSDLEAAAERKHGTATLAKKRATRTKRQETQRLKEEKKAKQEQQEQASAEKGKENVTSTTTTTTKTPMAKKKKNDLRPTDDIGHAVVTPTDVTKVKSNNNNKNNKEEKEDNHNPLLITGATTTTAGNETYFTSHC